MPSRPLMCPFSLLTGGWVDLAIPAELKSSPLFSYSSSGSNSSSWTAGYARQSDGFDQTLHLATSSDSTISFNLSATSITFLIPSYSGCTATISINSSSPTSACATNSTAGDIPFAVDDLPTGLHRLLWDSGEIQNGQEVIFWGIDGTRAADAGGMANVTIDDTFTREGSIQLDYQGDWSHLEQGASGTLSEVNGLSGDFNQTLSLTQSQGSSVSFSAPGSAIHVYGTVGPDYGSASVLLNGQTVATAINLTSAWPLPYELLWFQTGLDASQVQNVTMTNLGPSKMAIDFIILTTDPDSIPSFSAGQKNFIDTAAGKLVVGLIVPLVVICLLGLSIYYHHKRRRVPSRRVSRESGIGLATSAGGVIDDKASSTRSRSTGSDGEVFVSYDEARDRLSPQWHSPSIPRSIEQDLLIATITSSSSPLNDQSPTTTTTTTRNRPRPTDSVMTVLSSSPNDRRITELPAYPGETDTTSDPSFPDEKVAATTVEPIHLHLHRGSGDPGPSTARRQESIGPPSDFMSVYAAPPSERDDPESTTFSSLDSQLPLPFPPLSPMSPHLPTLISPNHLRSRSSTSIVPGPESAGESALDLNRATAERTSKSLSASKPPSAFSQYGEWPSTPRTRHSRTRSGVSDAPSAARPDSDVLPFEDFIAASQNANSRE
ncbi:hypothetical protein BCR39DRAFT_332826 [Naematelia encephala]|uniref:Uncharacterized protein n=1 Tax=Naematelia encephala TaxID=71784 RepID=A0A1Y2BED2_9TREE|nr:hypothetical protein BCR39DRAFT_332826 [Naematelia encephala]